MATATAPRGLSLEEVPAMPKLPRLSGAPGHVARDTYAGRYYRIGIPAGRQADTFTARELGAFANAEGWIIVWEFSGHTRAGSPIFVRSRFLQAEDGSLHGYDSEGVKKIIHPADRAIRVLTTKPAPAAPVEDCRHEHVRQISEHDVECLDCGIISA